MASRRFYWRMAPIVATLLVTALGPVQDRAVAQDNGSRSAADRGERPGRGGRSGGPGRDRGPSDSNRPAESSPAAPTPAASSTSFGTVSESERIRKSATDTIKKNDKNGDGILEGDELNDLRMSRGADSNGDGKITHNELVAFYTPKSAGTSTPQPIVPPQAESKTPAENLAKRKIVNTSRKSYRFKTAKERLPSWRFASRDANGDGQVSMSEYARSWTDRTAAEFQRYDKDNDGMITAKEAK